MSPQRLRVAYSQTANSFDLGSAQERLNLLNQTDDQSPRSVNSDRRFIPKIPITGFKGFDKACYGLTIHFRGKVTYEQIAEAVEEAAMRGAQNLKAYAKKSLVNSLALKGNPQSPIIDRGIDRES